MKLPAKLLCSRQSPVVPLKIFQNFINLLHLLFLCPFSIKYDEKCHKFYAVTKRWQQVIVRFIYALTLCFVVRVGLIDVQAKILRNPTSGIDQWTTGFLYTLWWSYLTSVFITLTFHESAIATLFNQLQAFVYKSGLTGLVKCKEDITNERKVFILNPKMVQVLSPVVPIFTLLSAFWDLDLFQQNMEGNSFPKSETYFGKSFLFSIDRAYLVFTGRLNYTMTNETFSTTDYGITALYVFINFIASLLTHTGYVLLICISLCTWIIVRTWVKQIENMQPSIRELKRVLDSLDEILKVFVNCEQAFGLLLCTMCLCVIPAYAIHMPELFLGGLVSQSQQLITKLGFCSIVFPAASVNSMISSVQTWIQCSYSLCRKDNDQDLNCRTILVSQKLSSSSVGISGKLFIITYGFIGNALGAVVTYAIIIIQLKTNNC